MAAFNRFNVFARDLANGVHNLDSDTLKVALTNSAPSAANATFSDITEISAGNGYSAGGATIANAGVTLNADDATLDGDDVVITAMGTVGPFRYVVLYNDTPTSPADPLIGWWDRGSALTLENGDSLTLSFDTDGILIVGDAP